VTERKSVLMDATDIARALTRIAHEILERNKSPEGLALVGIRTRGVPLAERIADQIGEIGGKRPDVGVLDINLYRDDLSLIADHPVLRKTEIPFELDGKKVVLVDDVLFTGRTIRAALDALIDLGRPAWIQLVALFVGKNVATARFEQVEVRLRESDGEDEVVLVDAPPGRSLPRDGGSR
jgi:pyrimidine operon attenuation protein/uracil phosphoribosyltransferase